MSAMWTYLLRRRHAPERICQRLAETGSRVDAIRQVRAARHSVAASAEGIVRRVAHSMPNFASQMRVAFSSMASNTGFKFAGRTADDLEHLGGGGLLLQQIRAAR